MSLLSVGVSGTAFAPNSTGADTVTSATSEAATPAAPAAPVKAAPAKAVKSGNVSQLLALGSYGEAVKLVQTMLNDNGFKLKVDGIFGPKTEAAVKSYQAKNSLKADGIIGPKTLAVLAPAPVPAPEQTASAPSAPAPAPVTPAPAPAAPVAEKISIQLGRTEYAAHGTKCFTVAVVAVSGDKVIAASIDDYQYMSSDVAKGVPNSDADFGKNVADPKMVLASKRANAAYYSEHMKEEAKATTPLDKSYDSIQAYVSGKTIAELEKTLSTNTKEQMVDAVSGATLVDTYGYVSAIVQAAKNAKANSAVEMNAADVAKLKLGRTEYAAHGTKCFTVAVAAVVGDKIIAASTDDYQYMSSDVAKGVPNSDADFGKNVADPKMVLASKRANAAYYSEHMKEEAKATTPLDKSYDSIQAYVSGKTIAELEKTLSTNTKEQMVDAVSGATLVDTYGYVSAIVQAAKAAK